jgi:hypothetical protein
MKRLSTILVLLLIAHNLFAQRKSRNDPQSFMAVEIGVPILNKTNFQFPIPLNLEFQRKNNKWGLGVNIALQYDKYSSGYRSNNNVTVGQQIRFTGIYPYPYVPYHETLQFLNLKPSVFGSYYFVRQKKFNSFIKLGTIIDIPILEHQNGEFYEIEIQQNIFNTINVKDAGPIHINRNIPSYQTRQIGLLSGFGVNYFLNKRAALRFTLQSEWYSNYLGDSILFALGGVNFRI